MKQIQVVSRSRRKDYRIKKFRGMVSRAGLSFFELFVRALSIISLISALICAGGLDGKSWEAFLIGFVASSAIFVLTGIIRLEVFREDWEE